MLNALVCHLCGKDFQERKTHTRHMNYCRKKAAKSPKTRKRSCKACTSAKTRCESYSNACLRCLVKGIACVMPFIESNQV
ncbi:hypothetical protein K461DRAFT_74756 [Myriangium duriaei CBS 260.36]|uniref:Zn(2)-C6 fungal-type domain-containing protein n=1 Tax=Myriangium duriaei CBS 260.36 TaxID=1168546 RepID=A0A9P4JAX5_9PEZI|nr:hypothetical protein K461DRAFT_74756 [Myriangium duriaei CBS 260.36]